ncbi:MAG: glycosyltransferase [Pseudolabrys sp.]|nr:glycosyltransferase [Pseudolabrys sp.]
MKILHVTPHLGGGVGKAHAAISAVLPKNIERLYLLLEEPRERRYADAIQASGTEVVVARGLHHAAALASVADVVQFEFWNHPRLFECLARARFAPMRSVFWSHISGLAAPLIPPGLIGEASRFVFTTPASRGIAGAGSNVETINSGFGLGVAPHAATSPRIAYLGTVDFVKMHRGFFDAIDDLEGHIDVSVWGAFEADGEVAAAARAMRHPERVTLCGATSNPAQALSLSGIFFYPLREDHFGTAENALIEAMSLGLVPVVMRNPAELAIVRHGETGLAAYSIHHAASLLQSLIDSPDLRRRLSANAPREAAQRTPMRSAQDLIALWRSLMKEQPRLPQFRAAIGNTPAEWFAATQGGAVCVPRAPEKPVKGTLAHFESVFAGDRSLARLHV